MAMALHEKPVNAFLPGSVLPSIVFSLTKMVPFLHIYWFYSRCHRYKTKIMLWCFNTKWEHDKHLVIVIDDYTKIYNGIRNETIYNANEMSCSH